MPRLRRGLVVARAMGLTGEQRQSAPYADCSYPIHQEPYKQIYTYVKKNIPNHYPVSKAPQLREGMYQPYTRFDTCGPVYKPL